jgi:hypothetical protein
VPIDVALEPADPTDDFCERFGIIAQMDGMRAPLRRPTERQKLERIRQVVRWIQDGYDSQQRKMLMGLHWGMRRVDRRRYNRAALKLCVARIKQPEVVRLAVMLARYEGIYANTFNEKTKLEALDRMVALTQLDKVDLKRLASEEDSISHDALRKHVAKLEYREIEAQEDDLREFIKASARNAGGIGDDLRSA